MAKFKILNKKGFAKDKIKRAQCMVKGKPYAAGEVVELEVDSGDATELVYNGCAEPYDNEAKKVFVKWKSPFNYTDAPVDVSKAVSEKK